MSEYDAVPYSDAVPPDPYEAERTQRIQAARARATQAMEGIESTRQHNRPACPLTRAYCLGSACAIAVQWRVGYTCGIIADTESGARRYVDLRNPANVADTNLLDGIARAAERIREEGACYG